jgi:hypothetical protein
MKIQNVSFPIDLFRLPEYYLLEKQLGKGVAGYVVLSLWRELGYEANNHPLGAVPKEFAAFMCERIDLDNATADKLLTILLDTGVLTESGDYYWCRQFAISNESAWSEGKEDSEFRKRLGDIQAAVAKHTRPITPPPEVDGKPVTSTESNSAIVTIRMIDSIFKRKIRVHSEFTEPLLIEAIRAYRDLGNETMLLFLRELQVRSLARALPRTAEQLFASFDKVMIFLQPPCGWKVKSMLYGSQPKDLPNV